MEDFQFEYTQENQIDKKEMASEKLANAAFILGIFSLFSVFCCLPFAFSALGIVLALLSKGASHVLKPKAKTGLILSIVGIVISTVMIVSTVLMPFILNTLNPAIGENYMKQFREIIEQNESYYRDQYGDETMDIINDFLNQEDNQL